MSELGDCASDHHETPEPAVVAGLFRVPWPTNAGPSRAAYCGRCAYVLGVCFRYFTPDDPTIDLASLAPGTAAAFEGREPWPWETTS